MGEPKPSPTRTAAEEEAEESPAAKKPRRADSVSVYLDTNAMPRADGRVLHLGLADGELADRIVVVGHSSRADLLAGFLEPATPGGSVFKLASDRGFLTYTGCFDGVKISVVSSGMGLAMMDFFVREGRAVVPEGPMAVVRFGTCGVLRDGVPVGSVSVASDGSILAQRNYGAFGKGPSQNGSHGQPPYLISDVCLPDDQLSVAVLDALQQELGAENVVQGLNVTADSFYGSQGRRDPRFHDDNEELLSEITKAHAKVVTMEMETFQLLHMARSCKPEGSIRAAAAVVNVANRFTGDVVSEEKLRSAESKGGRALLRALAGLRMS